MRCGWTWCVLEAKQKVFNFAHCSLVTDVNKSDNVSSV